MEIMGLTTHFSGKAGKGQKRRTHDVGLLLYDHRLDTFHRLLVSKDTISGQYLRIISGRGNLPGQEVLKKLAEVDPATLLRGVGRRRLLERLTAPSPVSEEHTTPHKPKQQVVPARKNQKRKKRARPRGIQSVESLEELAKLPKPVVQHVASWFGIDARQNKNRLMKSLQALTRLRPEKAVMKNTTLVCEMFPTTLKEGVSHPGAQCHACTQLPIEGIRWHCLVCTERGTFIDTCMCVYT
jgi:hypothetical protein